MSDPARVVAAADVLPPVADLRAPAGDEPFQVGELERERRVGEPERPEQLPLERAGEAAGRSGVDDPAHEQVARVRVRPALARLEVGAGGERARDQLLVAPRLGRRLPHCLAVRRQPAVVRDPARVVQQLPQRGARQPVVVDPGRDRRLQVELEAQAEHAEERLRDAVDEVAPALVHAGDRMHTMQRGRRPEPCPGAGRDS